MILYTMMPNELIFPYEPEKNSTQQVVNYQGIPLIVDITEDHHAQVVRILSSDPNHFMNDRVYPGAKISFANLEGLSAI